MSADEATAPGTQDDPQTHLDDDPVNRPDDEQPAAPAGDEHDTAS